MLWNAGLLAGDPAGFGPGQRAYGAGLLMVFGARRESFERSWSEANAVIGDEEFRRAWAQGSQMTADQAVEYVREKLLVTG